MIEVAELSPEYVLKLPAAVASRFRASDRFIVWTESDTVVLKRITPPSVTDVVAQAPQDVFAPREETPGGSRLNHATRIPPR